MKNVNIQFILTYAKINVSPTKGGEIEIYLKWKRG